MVTSAGGAASSAAGGSRGIGMGIVGAAAGGSVGFWGTRGAQIKRGPRPELLETQWNVEARNYMRDLLKNYDAPQMGVAGMTDTEQQGQSILAALARSESFEDPRESTFYKGFRQESRAEEERGASQLRRHASMGGMLRSTPALRAEGEHRADMSASRMQVLGALYDKERDRDNPYTRLQAISSYGALPRLIEQQKNVSQFAQQNQTDEVRSGMANQLLGYQPWYTPEWYVQPATKKKWAQGLEGIIGGATSGMGIS